jgi:hypothetical protein
MFLGSHGRATARHFRKPSISYSMGIARLKLLDPLQDQESACKQGCNDHRIAVLQV